MAGSGDRAVSQGQTVAQIRRFRLIGKACCVKSFEQPVATSIPSEHSTRAVGSMSPWGESNDQEFGCGVAEVWNRLAPVIFVSIGSSFFHGHILAVLDQSRALSAGNHLLVKLIPRRCFSL